MKRYWKIIFAVLCSLVMVLGTGCSVSEMLDSYEDIAISETERMQADWDTTSESSTSGSAKQTYAQPKDDPEPVSVEKDGSYTTPEEVAEYIHTFGTLPSNFITKKEAQALGWVNSKGNLWEVAPGKSIGGDYFGNYENILPKGKYHECDVNFDGGYRGGERIIYGKDGSIYYTNDHYETFTQLY